MGSKNECQPTLHQISELCYNKFRDLPKTGKPTKKQWTVLAGIVQYDKDTQSSKVVALATGLVRTEVNIKFCFLHFKNPSAPDVSALVNYVQEAIYSMIVMLRFWSVVLFYAICITSS